MHPVFHVPPRGAIALLADRLIQPIMRMPLITPRGESPQLTHFWNNMIVDRAETDHLEATAMVGCRSDPEAIPRRIRWDIRFHLGGWSRYTVIAPSDWDNTWYIGWITAEAAGVSQIPIRNRVRMLIGPEDVAFFGVRSTDYEQINLQEIAQGRIGNDGPFRQVPLH